MTAKPFQAENQGQYVAIVDPGDVNHKMAVNADGSINMATTVQIGSFSIDQTIEGTSNGIAVHGNRRIDAAFTTLTRPANVTAYSANDSISNSATAGSVTGLVATVSDLADAPVTISELLLDTNDTGLAAAVQVRAFLFNIDPTATTGVQAGDNAAWAQKRSGFVGSFSGTFRAFFDGGKARLVPDEGTFLLCKPSSGGTSLWIQYQALGAFTPSANSTTIDCRARGFQGRA